MNGQEILTALNSDPVCAQYFPIALCQDETWDKITPDSKHKLIVINSSSSTEKIGRHWLGLNLMYLKKNKTEQNKNKTKQNKTKNNNKNKTHSKCINNRILLLDSAGKNLKDTPVLEKAIKKALITYKAKLLSLKRTQALSYTTSCGAFLLCNFWLSCRKLLPSDIIKYFYTEKNTQNSRNFIKNDSLAAYFACIIFPSVRQKYTPLELIFDRDFIKTQQKKELKNKRKKKQSQVGQ